MNSVILVNEQERFTRSSAWSTPLSFCPNLNLCALNVEPT